MKKQVKGDFLSSVFSCDSAECRRQVLFMKAHQANSSGIMQKICLLIMICRRDGCMEAANMVTEARYKYYYYLSDVQDDVTRPD